MARKKPLSKETIADIRKQVLDGRSKTQVARDLNITFRTVWNHTKDIRTQKELSQKLKDKIRDEIKSGKSKYQTAKEYHLHTNTVYKIVKDLPSAPSGWPGIRGKTLDLLQELMSKGYTFSSCREVQQRYIVLRKYFPTINRITIYNRHIFYLKGKEDVAVRAFLENVNKKIISYQELRQVTEVFNTDITKKEKEAFLFKKPGKLRRFYLRLSKRIGKSKAIVATARKLLIIMYHMLTSQVEYEERDDDLTSRKIKRMKAESQRMRRLKETGKLRNENYETLAEKGITMLINSESVF